MDDTESSRHLFFVAIFGMTNCLVFVKKPTWLLYSCFEDVRLLNLENKKISIGRTEYNNGNGRSVLLNLLLFLIPFVNPRKNIVIEIVSRSRSRRFCAFSVEAGLNLNLTYTLLVTFSHKR